jgi:ABC-type glycerol-3-phosphate transport system permease component
MIIKTHEVNWLINNTGRRIEKEMYSRNNKSAYMNSGIFNKMFLDSESVSNWGPMFAMSVLSLTPVMLIFFIFQKQIVDGISTSGLKG